MRTMNFNFLKLTWLCLLTMLTIQLSAQEICDNAIDDDGDGLIDLNDTDCACSDLMASSLIPNPSFEDMTCCPFTEAELNCAVGWIQASTPTTDYVHNCGILGNPFLGYEAPLPFPDGEGAIGFRDGKPGVENFKEYAGSCLTQTMTVGTEYRLDFFVGFHDAPGSMTFDMAIFGSTECMNLPFGGGDQNFGCPTNGPGWVQLGAMTVNGENEWKNVVFDFVADQAYDAIVLGPACEINPNVNQDPYFFFDRLVLAESIMFEVPLAEITGNICEDNLVLTSSDGMGGTYQWYQDGVALAGETNQSLTLTNVTGAEGTYEVVVTTSTGCFSGEAYQLEIPSYDSTVQASFCDGGSVIIGGQEFDTAGTYDLELTASDGCDSLVTLILESTAIMTETIAFEGCEGDVLMVNNENYTTGGVYTQNLISVDGCDSILTVDYVVFDNSSSDLSFEACNGEEVIFNGQTYNMTGQYTQQLSNAAGCDSVINISIVSSMAVTENVSFAICDGAAIDINGQSYNQTGTYSQTLTSSMGCDSILNINVSQLQSSSSQLDFQVCEGSSLEVNGQSYNQAGAYTQSFTNAVGCDSIVNINVSNLPTAQGQLQFELCNSDQISVNGEVYASSGTYTQVLVANSGCDSVITIQIFESAVCSDCIFFEEFNAASIIITRLDDDVYALGLVQQEELKVNESVSLEEFSQFTAFYLIDNEVQLQGKKSKVQEIIDGQSSMKEILASCDWNKNNSFSKAEVSRSLPYSSAELPQEMNNKKLNHLYSSLINQCKDLPVGAQIKINLR